MFQKALLGFGPIKKHMRNVRMLPEEGIKIIRDFRFRLNVGVLAGCPDA